MLEMCQLPYYTMRLIPYIVLVHSGEENVNRMYNYIVRILAIYLQTVLIYQLKNYEKIDNQLSFMSIEYNVLFLSVANLMMWGVDTFLASQHVFSNDAPALFYGKRVWVNSYCLLFPFAMFYRFKCFVAFYGIYDRLRK
jgi:branched-subunit amino acid transport protein AzlD